MRESFTEVRSVALAGVALVGLSVGSLSFSGQSFAQTAEAEELEKDGKLPGDEGYPVQYSEPLKVGNESGESGLFLGAGLGFGQARTTEGDSSPGAAFGGQFEVGYQMRRGAFNRFEAGLNFFSATNVFRVAKEAGGKSELPIGLGVVARLGLGHSLGSKFFGVYKLGVGIAQAKYEAEPEGVSVSADGLTGLVGQLVYTVVMPMSDSFDLTGGFVWSHYQFDVDKVKVGGVTQDNPRSRVLLNVPQIELGARIRL
jgi:hypothetical protein